MNIQNDGSISSSMNGRVLFSDGTPVEHDRGHNDITRHPHQASEHAPSSMVSENLGDTKPVFLFSFMADFPWPFLVVLPLAFALLICFGWLTDDKIEDRISHMMIPTKGSYAQDKEYAKSYGIDGLGYSIFAAMAISRDGQNIMTEKRLEEVRTRMEATENTVIEYKGRRYTWDDFCKENIDPYRFPCLRLSAMDLYKESRWAFTEEDRLKYYQMIQDSLLGPRLPRLGILRSSCTDACSFEIAYRTDPESIGYPPEVASPISLLADIGEMEYNNPCRICIEDSFHYTILDLHNSVLEDFGYLQEAVRTTRDELKENTPEWEELNKIYIRLGILLQTVTLDDIEDFYSYYVAREMYGEMGVEDYLDFYYSASESIEQCQSVGGFLGWICPPLVSQVSTSMATEHLLNHADNRFSSVTTAGAPFPFWSEGDGTGVLFEPNEETGTLLPVSGSGTNMSAPMDSLRSYFGYLYFGGGRVSLASKQWKDLVEANPMFSWLVASVTPAAEGTMCSNGNLTGTATGQPTIDSDSAELLASVTPRWCTKYNVPNPTDTGTGNYSKQYFGRMWFDLLFDSILEIEQGKDDPYSWTTGSGCDYELGGERYSYTNRTDTDILHNSSRLLYNVDEGTRLGVVDRNLLIGGATPMVGDYDFASPLEKATTIQSIYVSLDVKGIQKRLKNCRRPGDGPLETSYEDAKELLIRWKRGMEDTWNKGWDNENDGEVQFISLFDDDGGAPGSVGRMLTEVTLDNNTLLSISVLVIALFSVFFMFSTDLVESRALLATVGVGLVVLSQPSGFLCSSALGSTLRSPGHSHSSSSAWGWMMYTLS